MKTRIFEIGIRSVEDLTIEASLSSEYPVKRHDGEEILEHRPESVDLSRSPLPLIAAHDNQSLPVGLVENLKIVSGKLRGILRFSKSQGDIWQDVKDGILRNISIGYLVQKKRRTGKGYIVTRWQPYEASLVAAPADPTVGIGRNLKDNKEL